MIWNPLRLLACYRSAIVTAEALAWHHGSDGVAMARQRSGGATWQRPGGRSGSSNGHPHEDRYDCINWLDGGAGADNMRGLPCNDVYLVDNAGDIVNESLAGSSGRDTVRSWSVSLADTTHVLGSVENLTLGGTGNINGTGNALNNVITGNAGINVLNGGAGADKITGGANEDLFQFNVGASQPDSTFTLRDMVLDFQGAGVDSGDVLELLSGQFALGWSDQRQPEPR